MLDKQGVQLLAVALLVLSRTWISDRIASLNGNLLFIVCLFPVFFVCFTKVIYHQPIHLLRNNCEVCSRAR